MAYDSTKPETNADLSSALIRQQFDGIVNDRIVLPKNYENYAAGDRVLWPGYIEDVDTLTTSPTWYIGTAIYTDRAGTLRFWMGSYPYRGSSGDGQWSSGSYIQLFKNGAAIAGTSHTLANYNQAWNHDVSCNVSDYFQVRIYGSYDMFHDQITSHMILALKCSGSGKMATPFCSFAKDQQV